MNIPLDALRSAAETVYQAMPPTPQYRWPLLCDHLGLDLWVKHENHTPVGAFKIRGGLVYFADLAARGAQPAGVISATRGNHGQSIGFAAGRYGVPATIVVPHGNSVEKNAAMRALGGELIEHGDDFQAAREHAQALAETRDLHMIGSFHPLLVRGVATYGVELLEAVPDLGTIYVPIGLGSGICGVIAAREALGRSVDVVGVVSAHATAYAQSFSQRRPIPSPAGTELADGVACRVPEDAALDIIWRGVDRIVEVTDDEVAAAIRRLFECTHNIAEGAGAIALAAIEKDRARLAGQQVAMVLTGGNIDRSMLATVLAAGLADE